MVRFQGDSPSAALPLGAPAPALPDPMRAQIQRAFGSDFSAVRAHEGSSADALGASAYTQGDNVHVRPGTYDPTGGGQELLGHELAHVVQQRAGLFRGQYD